MRRELAICPYCDTVHRRIELVARTTARCITCDSPLYHRKADLDAMLAVTLTATIGFAIANVFPLVALTSGGLQTEATLREAIMASYDRHLPIVAIVLATTLVFAPMLEIGMLLWVLVPLRAGTRPPGFRTVMRALRTLRPWRMVEVFLLGFVIAVVKLTNLATTTPNWGIFGFAVMTIALAALGTVDRDALWRRADEVRA